MIDTSRLLADLTRRLKILEDDLRQRVGELPALQDSLQSEWSAARDAQRTADTFETWLEPQLTQAAVHWLLSCVFVRFIEDNELVDRPWLSGPPASGRLALAVDRHEAFFRAQPGAEVRDYLLACFREAGALHGLHTFFDEAHNPVFRFGISGDAAIELLRFWQERDTASGELLRDFTDPQWSTRFLGDLYQDLSIEAQKRYALLQTPEFVEEFILDRTLTPAIREFGYREVRMIDPTCGSGHFLLGGFRRLLDEWARNEPERNTRDTVQRALDGVAGVDLNPFAVAIARFRLLVAALQACGERRLEHAPDFRLHIAIGDSLLHGHRFGLTATDDMFRDGSYYAGTGLSHAYATEDLQEVNEILGRQYHAVVGNPPYIVVKDAALNRAYREIYASCHMKYSLGAPFTERFFELAQTAREGQAAGYVGLITTNAFMKREFGSKLIEQVLPRLDLTQVIDTSGAYIPGHGTPTVILFGRHRAPVAEEVRTVMGIKGEPSIPSDPTRGLVWSAITAQLDVAGSESEFVSVANMDRQGFAKHPWSIGGGGAADLKEEVDGDWKKLGNVADSIGITAFTLEDEVFINAPEEFGRHGVPESLLRTAVSGDQVRDWFHQATDAALFPYDTEFRPIDIQSYPGASSFLWLYRTLLSNNKMFGKQTKVEAGLKWWEYGRLTSHKLRSPLSITFAEIATHNHFVLDRGGKVFKQTAPVIKLPAGASEAEHLGLLGLLNSSVACFWLQQVCHNKGRPGADIAGADERFEMRYAINATNVAEFPLPIGRPLEIAALIDRYATKLQATLPASVVAGETPSRASLDAARERATSLRRKLISLQEELDWQCLQMYGLTSAENSPTFDAARLPEITLGERAFEIALARRVKEGREQTVWFERHGSKPITEIPAHWPADYRQVFQRRIALIESGRNIGLIERPEYKRRWNTPDWSVLERDALRAWLLDRLESERFWPRGDAASPALSTTHRLADAARRDAADFDLAQLVAALVAAESVPFLPVLRYTDSGLRKRAQWEDTWALQRREDAGEEVGRIPVPPKYQGKDFLKTDWWRLRGGLDVAKERWVSYPGCERGADGSLPIAWAGWNHLQQATALAAYAIDMKENEGWDAARLAPLLAGLQDLLPWLRQWHNDLHPVHGERMGDYHANFVEELARELGFTLADLKAWKAATAPRRARRKAAA